MDALIPRAQEAQERQVVGQPTARNLTVLKSYVYVVSVRIAGKKSTAEAKEESYLLCQERLDPFGTRFHVLY